MVRIVTGRQLSLLERIDRFRSTRAFDSAMYSVLLAMTGTSIGIVQYMLYLQRNDRLGAQPPFATLLVPVGEEALVSAELERGGFGISREVDGIFFKTENRKRIIGESKFANPGRSGNPDAMPPQQ